MLRRFWRSLRAGTALPRYDATTTSRGSTWKVFRAAPPPSGLLRRTGTPAPTAQEWKVFLVVVSLMVLWLLVALVTR